MVTTSSWCGTKAFHSSRNACNTGHTKVQALVVGAAHPQAGQKPWDDLRLCQAVCHKRHWAEHSSAISLPSALQLPHQALGACLYNKKLLTPKQTERRGWETTCCQAGAGAAQNRP